MNYLKISAAIAIVAFYFCFTACKKKDNAMPVEQELITTMKLLISDTGAIPDTFVYRIENGFGSTTQGTVHIDTLKLKAGRQYVLSVLLFNEKANPVENTTEQVLAERNMHVFLYQSTPVNGPGSVAFFEGTKDYNNLPFNQSGLLAASTAGTGTLTITLMHAPTNKNGATPDETGGETDVLVEYPVVIR